MERTLVFTATYNEADNVQDIITSVFEYLPETEMLIIDDASPDGTGNILNELSQKHKKLSVIHRPNKLGLGTAHKLAMKYAIKNDFDILITMDADFSHHPKYLPTMVNLIHQNDFVTGSRYIKGGGQNYGLFRKSLSVTANLFARNLLGIPLRECTTSYRGFQVSLLRTINLDSIQSEGYSFFVESIYYVHGLTKKIDEFPIFFSDRQSGTSKISKLEIFKSIFSLGKLFCNRIFPEKLQKEFQSLKANYKQCPNCTSLYQTLTSIETKNGNDQLSSDSTKKLQCLQCGTIYI